MGQDGTGRPDLPSLCICKCVITYITHQFIITSRSRQTYIIVPTSHRVALPFPQHHRALLCSVCSATELCYVLQHHRAPLCSVTELCSVCSTTSQSSTLLCLLCNRVLLCSACNRALLCLLCNIIELCSALSQIAKHTFQSIHYCSLIIPTCCSEIQFHCSECSQFAKQFS